MADLHGPLPANSGCIRRRGGAGMVGCWRSSGPGCGCRRLTPPGRRAPRSAPTTATRRRRRTRRGQRRTSWPQRRGLSEGAAVVCCIRRRRTTTGLPAWRGDGCRIVARGVGVRAASGLLAAARLVRRPETAQMLALLAQLAALAEAVGRMRTEQDRAVQAAAARRAAEQIRAEHTRRLAGAPGGPVRAARTAADDGRRHPGPRPPEQPRGRSRKAVLLVGQQVEGEPAAPSCVLIVHMAALPAGIVAITLKDGHFAWQCDGSTGCSVC